MATRTAEPRKQPWKPRPRPGTSGSARRRLAASWTSSAARRATDAVTTLTFAPQSASDPVKKVLESAIANARVKADRESVAFDERDLVISAAFVDEGPTMKRFRPRAQGRAGRINKRTSHITVVVSQLEKKKGAR